jgi:hypothetical protein
MKQSFSRRPAAAVEHIGFGADLQNVISFELSFVDAARCNRQAQGLAADNGAEVTARAKNPAASVEASADLGEFFGCRREEVKA